MLIVLVLGAESEALDFMVLDSAASSFVEGFFSVSGLLSITMASMASVKPHEMLFVSIS